MSRSTPVPSLFPAPRTLSLLGGEHTGGLDEVIERQDPSIPPQGYRLTLAERGELAWSDERGRRHGRSTLRQLSAEGAPPRLRIDDWPDFAERGYLLDISRDRVPTRQTLARLVHLLGLARYTQLQLYIEHTYAYADHEEVWRDASPMTPADLRWLEGICAEQGIELVPNQNVFGHMERWLSHPRYLSRAEAPEGFDLGGRRWPPACLEPTQQNADFAHSLLDELTSVLTSRRVNIGGDEPFELGLGRSAQRVAERGRGAVYLEHVLRLTTPLIERGYEVQLWADILGRHPELAVDLPRAITPIVWMYDSPTTVRWASRMSDEAKRRIAEFDAPPDELLDGFAARARPISELGIPFWVAPGTSTWLSLVGRLDNACENIRDAAAVGRAHGAEGILVTQWADGGAIEPPSLADAPLLYAGGVAWASEPNAGADAAALAGRLAYEDPTGRLGEAIDLLGRQWSLVDMPMVNMSPLYAGVFSDPSEPRDDRLDAEVLHGVIAAIDTAIDLMRSAQPRCADAELVVRELTQSASLARLGARRLLCRLGEPAPTRRELDVLIAEQEACWRARARPGGLHDSLARLEAVRTGAPA